MSLQEKGSTITVALLDRHLMFRQGLECLLKNAEETTLVGSIESPDDVSDCFCRVDVNVLIFELDFQSGDPLRLIGEWSRDFPQVGLLALSAVDERLYAERAVRAGAKGFVSKCEPFDKVLEALSKIAEGKLAVSPEIEALLLSNYSRLRKENGNSIAAKVDHLSDRELLVLTLIGQGMGNAAIAKTIGVSPKTVGAFKERIKEKLAIYNSYQLTQFAAQAVTT
ncbi:MAG TPA: response regulator transcription factor [Opitutales bacterium]|nr:response regulator transcription factor [Opitutales bacterium]